MSKRVLITAGPVYGRLDDNKIVSNRSRGIWAIEFAKWLGLLGPGVERLWWHDDDYEPILLVPDIARREMENQLDELPDHIELHWHSGYDDYREQCHVLAATVDTAVMAAAVVNWIPETPFKGKMPTDTDRQLIPFILAPRVINEMKAINPSLTLIGCKLLFGGDEGALIDAAYHVVLAARCNAVIANDAKLGLRSKYVVHQDRTVVAFDDDFNGLYKHLRLIIDDVHYKTREEPRDLNSDHAQARSLFDHLVEVYRSAFVKREANKDFVFGAVAVRTLDGRYLVSPREKGTMFSSWDAVLVNRVEDHVVYTQKGKASLNAPLLIRHLEAYPNAHGVIHYHSERDGWERELGILGQVSDKADPYAPVVPYAPPGTVRDNERAIPAPSYKIHGHGWIIAVDINGAVTETG